MAKVVFQLLAIYFLAASAAAQIGHRETPEPELRVCTQNGQRLGESKSEQSLAQLSQRIIDSRCDIIAVQELEGGTKKEAEKNAKRLARELRALGTKDFLFVVGDANDSPIRNAFFYSPALVELERFESFAHENLPMLQEVSKARRSLRGPDALLLRYRKPGHTERHLYLVTFHFKSKVQGWKDPAGTQFEATRLEMAEGLRQAVLRQLPKLPRDTLVLTMGDRNSEPTSASAEVLTGLRTISDFRRRDGCSIDKSLAAHCPALTQTRPLFVSAFDGSPSRGSYKYQGRLMFLDDILIRAEDRWVIQDESGTAVSGVSGTFGKGSDHKLLWVELNW